MRSVIAWFRFVLVILSMVIIVLGAYLIAPFSIKTFRYPIRKIWAVCIVAATGAKFNLRGEDLSKMDLKNTMVVSNHISWLDTVIMLRTFFVSYVGKVEMLNWPILRVVIKAGGTIFLDRKNKRELVGINRKVANALQSGATIGLYPEGTTGDGVLIKPFKAPLLEAAMLAKSKIVPVVLSYRKEDDQLATEVSFSGVGWMTTVMNTLRLKNLVINVTVLPAVDSTEFSDREVLSEYLYKQINDSYMSQQKS